MQIKIKTALAHELQKESEEAKRELASIQEYVDKNILDLEEETIYFIPLQGSYIHVKRSMVFVGVVVSTMKKSIQGIEGTLKTKLEGYEAEVANVQFEFVPEFLGKLNYAEGFPIHLEVPVRGLQEDQMIKSSSFQCELSDVKILCMNNIEEKNDEN